MNSKSEFLINSVEQLQAHYGKVGKSSFDKEIDYISADYRTLIEKSTFVVIATSGAGGLDCTPRGDPAGFVKVVDQRTLMLPDRRGNNRLDTLRNLIEDQRISLLFLIPGIGQTVRVNGTAKISIDPNLLDDFKVQDKPPQSVIIIKLGTIYFQCSKALIRSKLWDASLHLKKSDVPTPGQILQSITNGEFDGTAYDVAMPERYKKILY